MATSTRDSVVRSIPHITALHRKTTRPLIYTIAWLALAHFAQCNVPRLPKVRHYRAKLNNNNGMTWTTVHLLGAEEVLGIFGGVAAGLGLLVRVICLPNQIARC